MLFTTGINLISIDRSVLKKAAELRSKSRVKTPDAIHLATAKLTGCDRFLTNDKELAKISVVPVDLLDNFL